MMYQALMSRGCNKNLWIPSNSIKFVVWESYCGPYPEITPPRLSDFMRIARDLYKNEGKTELEAAGLCAAQMKIRGFPGLYARWRGEKMSLSKDTL